MKKNNKNKKNKYNPKNIWKSLGGNLLIWVLIIIMAVTALQFFSTDYKPQTRRSKENFIKRIRFSINDRLKNIANQTSMLF